MLARGPVNVADNVCSTLEKAGVVKTPEGGFNVETFVNTSVAKLV